MGWLYLGYEIGVNIWAGNIKSGEDYEYMGLLYLCQDMGVSVWAGCI
jgi:hypothetical protein